MSLVHVALVSEESSITMSELSIVSSALQKQVTKDFGPIWGITATVDAFRSLDDVPVGTWPIVVMDNIKQSTSEGIHEDKDGHPMALVKFDKGWSLTASHECLEMLADPNGNRTMPGHSPKKGQGESSFWSSRAIPAKTLALVTQLTV